MRGLCISFTSSCFFQSEGGIKSLRTGGWGGGGEEGVKNFRTWGKVTSLEKGVFLLGGSVSHYMASAFAFAS